MGEPKEKKPLNPRPIVEDGFVQSLKEIQHKERLYDARLQDINDPRYPHCRDPRHHHLTRVEEEKLDYASGGPRKGTNIGGLVLLAIFLYLFFSGNLMKALSAVGQYRHHHSVYRFHR